MRCSWRRPQVANELQKAAAAKDAEIQALKAQLDARRCGAQPGSGAGPESAVEKQRDALANELERCAAGAAGQQTVSASAAGAKLQGVNTRRRMPRFSSSNHNWRRLRWRAGWR